jgi:hypothetical protein
MTPKHRRWSVRPQLEALEDRCLLSIGLSTTKWTPIGPAPIHTPGVAQGFSAGRIEVAAPDPTNSDVMYIGADNGGVWKTGTWNRPAAEGGPVWIPLTDDQPSLNFNGYHPLVVHPGNHNLIYGLVSGPGAGVLRSTNGGLGWQLLANSQFEGANLGSLAVHPADMIDLYMAVWSGGPGGGVYKSSDGGATWTNKTASFHAGGASDVVVDPSNPNVLYAGLIRNGANGATTAGVYKSSDGGDHWSWLAGSGLPSGSFVGAAIRLAIAPSSPSIVYATSFYEDINGNFSVLRYRTSNSGQTWAPLTATPGKVEDRSFHVVLAVDPTDANHVFANDAYALYESKDGGRTWAKAESIGDDWVNMTFDAGHNGVATGDRDIHSYNVAAKKWDAREGNLQVTEFWDLTLDPQNPDLAYGVAQDHLDAMKFQGDVLWHYMPDAQHPGDAGGGDEYGKVLVDPTNSNLLYVFDPLDPANFVRRSTDGGNHWTTIRTTNSYPSEKAAFAVGKQIMKSFVMDPGNPKRLLLGTTEIFETTNADAASPTWTSFSQGPFLPSSDPTAQYITALAVSGDGQSVYAATADGHIWVKRPNQFWAQTDANLFGNGAVKDFDINPTDSHQAYAVTTGAGGKNVWYLSAKTGTWANVTGDLPPNLRVSTIFVDWQYAIPALYVGTERGVYHSVNLGGHWEKFGQFLPNTNVQDLQYLPQQHILAAGTAGRGAWEILIPAASVGGQVYWDHNGNAAQDANDKGLANVTVFLDADGNGVQDPNEYGTKTDATGHYSFAKVPPGTYSIRQVLPAGFVQTTPNFTNVAVTGSNLAPMNFGDFHPWIIKPIDLTKFLNVSLGRPMRQGKKGLYRQTITMVFDRLDKRIKARGAAGFLRGPHHRRSPFVTFSGESEIIGLGESRTVVVQWFSPMHRRPRYTPHVVAGDAAFCYPPPCFEPY